MGVAIRLARLGSRHRPIYRIVAADQRARRDGRFLEKLGTYDPIPRKDGTKVCSLDFTRTKHWLSVGAQPTDRVAKLLGMAGLTPPAPQHLEQTVRNVPRKERTTST